MCWQFFVIFHYSKSSSFPARKGLKSALLAYSTLFSVFFAGLPSPRNVLVKTWKSQETPALCTRAVLTSLESKDLASNCTHHEVIVQENFPFYPRNVVKRPSEKHLFSWAGKYTSRRSSFTLSYTQSMDGFVVFFSVAVVLLNHASSAIT